MSECILYREWLPLERGEFRILVMLAQLGEFRGNLSDMCRHFSLTSQTSNRNRFAAAIQSLAEQGFVESQLSGRTYTLKAVPKAQIVAMPRDWLDAIMRRDYSAASVSWEVVLKVLMWLCRSDLDVVTREEIAVALGICEDTVTSALNVLERDYEAITRSRASLRLAGGQYRTLGLRLTAAAWWNQG